MNRVERHLLVRLGRRSGDPDTVLRFQAVAGLAAGRSSVRVADGLHVARPTVVSDSRRFDAFGVDGLYDRRRFNGATKADDAFHRRVAEVLRGTPEDLGWSRPTWTRELLCVQMKREGWPAVAVCTMGRVLATIGARVGMPKPVVLCPWPRDARLRRLAAIRRLDARATATEPVLYEEEVDIHLNPKISRDWMLRGEQRRIVTPGKNQKFYLAGALDVRTGALHTTGAPTKNASLFCDLPRVLAAKFRHARRVHLVVDSTASTLRGRRNRPSARSAVGSCCTSCRPYCPDAKRIERVWQDLHANATRNHRRKTINQLLANAPQYLNAHVWRRTTGSAPLRQAA